MSAASLLLLRLGLAFVFLWEGMAEVFRGTIPAAIPDILARMPNVSMDAPRIALILGIVQLVIGILLVLGLFTRFTAVLAVIYLLSLTVLGGMWSGLSLVQHNIALLTIAVALLLNGGGSMSVDAALTSEDD